MTLPVASTAFAVGRRFGGRAFLLGTAGEGQRGKGGDEYNFVHGKVLLGERTGRRVWQERLAPTVRYRTDGPAIVD